MRPFKISEMRFTITELRDIALSVFVLGLLFTFGDRFDTWNEVIINFLISTLILGLSFVLHELGHKFVAQSYGAQANYTIWLPGLIISMVIGISSGGRFIFFAPGFVAISTTLMSRFGFRHVLLGENEAGQISVAGPLTNIILLFLFKIFSPIIPPAIWIPMVIINAWLALFNLLPVPPLDGSKVFFWRRDLWIVLFGISILSLFFAVGTPLLTFIAVTIGLVVATMLFMWRFGFLAQ